MQNIAVVYYSGYGHTKLVAEKGHKAPMQI